MCTVSIIPVFDGDPALRGGFRVVCNRDENHSRPPAAAPKWRNIGNTTARAIWPMDLEAGGTWIGAAEHGLCLCLLNLNLEPPGSFLGRGKLRSRGLLIPELLAGRDLEEVEAGLRAADLRQVAPFRLIAIDLVALGLCDPRVLEARWDHRELQMTWHGGMPVCFVSSGLGDSMVQPRLDLFEEAVVAPGATPERQDAFHRHMWPDRPEISVLMSREDARTVSVTTLEVRHDAAGARGSMNYEPVRAQHAAPLTR